MSQVRFSLKGVTTTLPDLELVAADLTALRSAFNAAPAIDGASLANLQPLVTALNTAIADVSSAQAAADQGINTTGVAGVVAGGDGLAMAAGFLTCGWFAGQDADLNDLSSYLNRMALNIAAAITG